MNTEYTLDADGKIKTLTHNGKAVKAGYMRGLRKAQETNYWILYEVSGTGINPFSGVEMKLDPFETSIYAWLIRWYRMYEAGGPELAKAPIQAYDDVKYLLLEINHEAYYALID